MVKRGTGLARLRVAAVVAVVVLPTLPSGAAAPSTFEATTTVGSTVLPHPAAVGGWTLAGTKATLDVTVVNPAPAVTRVEAGWVSPFVRARGYCLGRYRFLYRNHSLVTPPPHVIDRVRYREQGGRWSRWYTELEEDYLETTPEMSVESGLTDDCVFLFRTKPRRPMQLEVRHVVTYGGTHRIEETLAVAVP